MPVHQPIIKIFDTERGYRFLVPQLRKLGITIDINKDVILGSSLAGLIKVMDELRRQAPEDILSTYFKAMLYGAAGSGKSYTSVEIIRGLVEEGVQTPILLIDSASVVWKNFVEAWKQKTGVTRMFLQHWGQVIPLFEAQFNSRVKDYPFNMIITGRVANVYEAEKDADGRVRNYNKTDTKAKLAGDVAYEPDVVVEMEQLKKRDGKEVTIIHQAVCLKDRSSVIQGTTCDNPTWAYFKPVYSFLLRLNEIGIPPGDGCSDHDIIEADETDRKDKNNRLIVLERNRALLDEVAAGTTKDAKAMRLSLMKYGYHGETSDTAVAEMTIEHLEEGNRRLTEIVPIIKKILGGEEHVYQVKKAVVAARTKYLGKDYTEDIVAAGLDKLVAYQDHIVEKYRAQVEAVKGGE